MFRLPTSANSSLAIPLRFTRPFVVTLGFLALLLTAEQFLMQWRLRAAQDELWVIRYTALQRHLSQQIVKKGLQLTDAHEQADFRANQAELQGILRQFVQYHENGRQGLVPEHNVAITLPASEQGSYADIRPHYEALKAGGQALLRARSSREMESPAMQATLKLVLTNENLFLEKIDGIVRQQTGRLRERLGWLQQVEFYLYVFTLLLLLGVGLLIFRPALRKLRQTVGQLIDAEKRTAAANQKLLALNKALKATRQQLYEATKQQYQQEIDAQKLRTSYLVAGQEDERKRLSRELHDGLGQMLTAIKLQVDGLEAQLIKQAATDPAQTAPVRSLQPLKTLITQTIQETRNISNNLMPTVLSDFGVVPALRGLADIQGRNAGVSVTFETDLPPVRLDKPVEIMLYRVTQEAVTNALRHGHARHVAIELFERDDYLHLLVEDDGRGFRPRAVAGGGQGLHNMQERAKLLGGKFRIQSAPSKGTKIQVSVPYHAQHIHDTYQINARG